MTSVQITFKSNQNIFFSISVQTGFLMLASLAAQRPSHIAVQRQPNIAVNRQCSIAGRTWSHIDSCSQSHISALELSHTLVYMLWHIPYHMWWCSPHQFCSCSQVAEELSVMCREVALELVLGIEGEQLQNPRRGNRPANYNKHILKYYYD